MPIYEYRCTKCERRFEVIQKFSDQPLTVHEECGGAVERLLSAPAFQFKGTGWYVTDYAKGGSGGAIKPGSAKGSESGESKPSESKPAESSKPSTSESPAPAKSSDSSSSTSKS